MTATATNQSLEVPLQLLQDLKAEGSLHSTTGSEVYLRLLSLQEQKPAWTKRLLVDGQGISLGNTNYCPRFEG